MNIKTASQKTGLTKKAIKYYESENLINPSKNIENNYREYTDEDIVRLNLIATLRTLDIPIAQIRSLLEGNKNLQEVMKDTLNKITETISNLEKSKIAINNIINKQLDDYSYIGEQVTKFRETLEFSQEEKNELICDRVLKTFPGYFGEIIINFYGPFLNVAIDSDDKKDAWLKLVELLDNITETDVINENPFIKNINDMCDLKDDIKSSKYNMLNFLQDDITKKHNYKNRITSFIESIKENGEFREKLHKVDVDSTEIFSKIGASLFLSSNFDEHLSVLSEDYKKIMEIRRKVNSDICNELKK